MQSSVDLTTDDLHVLIAYGSLDAGAATYTDAANVEGKLGSDVTVDEIGGGNHEQMGWYTGQPNDPPATISRQEQQDRVVAATVALLQGLGTAAP